MKPFKLTSPERHWILYNIGNSAFILCLAPVLGYELIGISQVAALIIAFLITALWWIGCSVPLARSYKHTFFHYPPRRPYPWHISRSGI